LPAGVQLRENLLPVMTGAAAARFRTASRKAARMSDDQLREYVELVRRVRHDANNPITAALGHVQLLLDDPAVRDPDVRESLGIVESELRRLIEILRELGHVRPPAS
jgi:signal transduction histidine kinase